MQALATTLTVIRGKLQPEERAAATRSTGQGGEPECWTCDDAGWRRVQWEDSIRLTRCECVDAKVRAARLAAIPERFKDSSFESFKPHYTKQERALSLMQKDPGGSWYLTGAYGNGKTHCRTRAYASGNRPPTGRHVHGR